MGTYSTYIQTHKCHRYKYTLYTNVVFKNNKKMSKAREIKKKILALFF